jgi:hypothetical protein
MDDSFTTIQELLRQIGEHLQSTSQSQKNAAATKLHRVAALASTLAFTVKGPTR